MASRRSSKKSKVASSTAPSGAHSAVPSPAEKAPSHMATAAASAATTAKAATAQASAGDGSSATGEAAVVVRRKDFIERVSASSGLRKNQIKPAMEAVFRELGAALAAGETLNIPPLGKVQVNRIREAENATVIVAKLRRSKNMLDGGGAQAAGDADDEDLADAAE
ncbi:MAG: HU family DNA-binding protein [Paracoccaceae bacterium]